ncbi:MAG TPA: DUF6483 family protein [Ktedonobacteraceae bacterium]|nr:DUF6483 family protein [Ktedonobacteraceae bacterium]
MTQKDYILRMFEEIGRIIAQVIYLRQMKDYQGAHELIDEQLKQTVGMGSGFLHSMSDETLLAMLTTLGMLNIDKCWLVATLLKAEGEIYEEQQDENNSFQSSLKACNLFLEALFHQYKHKNIEIVEELEELANKLEVYELPFHTRELLFWYFEHTGRYSQAEDTLFDILEMETSEDGEAAEEVKEILEKGEAFYTHLRLKSDEDLNHGNFSRDEIEEGHARLHSFRDWING